MKKLLVLLYIVFSITGTTAQTPAIYSSSDILQKLKKLGVLGSVLYIGAHPDDENNALLPWLANEKNYRTAYLSLTRGDGGQNLIGDEQGVELGLIRTQELLAARRVDGAEQYFTRAYEFGFSKSSGEALTIWDKEKILSDVVWIIRQYQPDVIIKRFPSDARAGHGHHAASSLLADEAYIAAADPAKFPEQFKYGVKPWQSKRILWNTFNFGGTNTTSDDQLKIDIGGFNSLFGKSYGEMGGEARTMHKSQGEGRPRRRGQIFEYFKTTGGDAPRNDLMDGIITGWKRLAGGEAIQVMLVNIIINYKPDKPELSIAPLIEVFRTIKSLPAGSWRDKKLAETQQLIEACSALYAEATSAQQKVVQGDTLRMNIVINKRKNLHAVLKNVRIENFDSSFSTTLSTNQNLTISKTLKIAGDKKISQPYWLQTPLKGGTFEVNDQLMIGKAENDPSFEATMVVNIEGEDFVIRRPVMFRFIDPVKGELYQPIPVYPKVELSYTKENFISINGAPVNSVIHIKSNLNEPATYTAVQHYSGNWANDQPSVSFELAGIEENNRATVFTSGNSSINTTEEINLDTKDTKYDGYTKTIDYDHIPTITYFPKAKANLVKLDIKKSGKKIGYIIGAGDRVQQALEQMGYEVKILSQEDINDENLKQFDAIITGIRAYNIHPYLSNLNDVMMRYVESGGNLIVQYLKSNLVDQKRVKVGPYPFVVDPSSRVTEENAKVEFLLPAHAVLNFPNKITEKDFDGWVQERSTYQALQLDPHYETPLGMNDKNEKQSNGSLVIAKYGKGNFVYSGLVFFRALPAGVPGAYRLMANLIGLSRDKQTHEK